MNFNPDIAIDFEFGVVPIIMTLDDGLHISRWEQDGEYCFVEHDDTGDYFGAVSDFVLTELGLI